MPQRRGRKRSRQRRGSRRSSLAQASGTPISAEFTHWIMDSQGQSRRAGEEYYRSKTEGSAGQRGFEAAAKKTFEIYVGNVLHGTLAPDLVKYFHGEVVTRRLTSDSTGASILRCQVKRKHRGNTFAFVTLRSREIAEALMSGESLIFGGRRLNIGPSKAKFKRPVGVEPGFKCGGFQLCAEWPPGELTCLWAVKSGLKFQVSRTSSLTSLMFKDGAGGEGVAEFKRRHVDGEVELAMDADKAWLVFRLLRPPFLKKEHAQASTPFGNVSGSGSIWELDDGQDGRTGGKLVRVGDLSPNGAFGRCLVYRIDVSELLKDQREKARLFRQLHAFRLCTQYHPRRAQLRFPVGVNIHIPGEPLNGWQHLSQYRGLPYGVRYLVECLTSNLKIDPFGVREEAVSLLSEAGQERACLALRSMLATDPRARLEQTPSQEIQRWLGGLGPRTGVTGEIGRGNVMIPRASVTPLRVVCQPPEMEMSSGVTRHFAEHSERFLRVNFVDENMGRLPTPLSDSLEDRLKKFLDDGLEIAGRTYKFLAYSGSQLRGHSCFFYAVGGEGGAPTESDIRSWMGDMSGIDVIGKYGARLGQSLSSTTSTVEVPPSRKKLVPDKAAGPYEFTDGCGMMSEGLARDVADHLGYSRNEPPPSAFQIRMGGCKGMLAVWPESVMKSVAGSGIYKVLVRPSMQKFPSDRNNLEVIQCARELPCYLNRQFITLLSTLGVPDEAIEQHYWAMVATLDKMVDSSFEAERSLERYYNTTARTRKAKKQHGPLWEALAMVKAGFDVRIEPFLQSVLRATRHKAMIDLRHRTRIFIPDAVCLLGIVDETGLLEPGQVFFSVARVALPAGTHVLVCRNPSLHPGDLRVLKTAGDLPQLRHLVNVVVFSCMGDRPEPSKMSGGDLDGDLYSVVWDPDLLPPRKKPGDGFKVDDPEHCENSWNYPAMGYEPPEKPVSSENPASSSPQGDMIQEIFAGLAKTKGLWKAFGLDEPENIKKSSSAGGVTIKEITKFFVDYIQNDNLGKIANAHLVWADRSDDLGARCQQCLQLAALHSKAVDFPKSGVPAKFPEELRIEMYPDFMCKKGGNPSYPSKKLIGRMFRDTPKAALASQDEEFLGGFELEESLLVSGWEAFLPEAEANFAEYIIDLMNLANKYGVTDEGQLVSGQVERFAGRMLKRTKLEDAQARLNMEVAQVKAKFRDKFQGHSHEYDGSSSDSEECSEEGSEEGVDAGNGTNEDQEKGGAGVGGGRQESSDGSPRLKHAPEGAEAYQKASAWYYVSHSDTTNPYLSKGRDEWQGKERPQQKGSQLIMYLSFPWVCAYEQLCQIKRITHDG